MAFRTQKISQMTPKGADLEATDLIEVSTIESGSYVTRSITGQELIDAIPAPTGFVPETRTLTINGVTQDLSADRSWTIATGLTVGTTPIASGTIGRVLFQGTGNVLQQSSSLFWDNTNERLGIGTGTPSGRFHVKGSVASEIFKAESTIAALYAQFVSSDGACEFGIYTDALYFQPLPSLANGTRFLNGGNTIIMQLAQTGNVQIGTTTDAGFRLDVNGTARVQGNATFSTNLSIGTTLTPNKLTLYGDAMNIKRNGANLNVGLLISDDTKNWQFIANRATNSLNIYDDSLGANRFIVSSAGNILINTTTDAGFRLDVNGTARVDQTLQLNGTGTGTLIAMGGNIGRFTIDGSFIRFKVTGGGDLLNMTTNFFGVNQTSTISSAIMAITSTDRGFLPPRMTTTQKNAIASPATGLQVFDTTLNQMSYYNGTTWTNI